MNGLLLRASLKSASRISRANARADARANARFNARTVFAACCALALAACATPPKPPPTANESLPLDLRATQNEMLQEVMTTHGDETYICRRIKTALPYAANPQAANAAAMLAVPRDGTQLLWDETGSEATLVDADGKSVGTVAPGRYFLAYDGSYVIGNVPAENQIGANALTWARYTTKFDATRRPGEGRFADVTSIQRIDTTGGLPPQPACDLEGAHLLVPYSATYMFYRALGNAPLSSAALTPAGALRTTQAADAATSTASAASASYIAPATSTTPSAAQ